MDSEAEEIYLQKLESFILDEDKIVTVTWLCLKLGINADNSRHLLDKYVKDHRNSKPNDLAVAYLLSGLLEDDTLMYGVVKESEVEHKRKTFKVVYNQIIYSVQKCKQIDFVAVALVDSFDAHAKKEAAILGSAVSKLSILRVLKAPKSLSSPPKQTVKAKTSFFTAAPKTDKPKKVEKIEETKPVESSKKSTKPKQNGIANFFNPSNNKSSSTSKSKISDEIKMEVDNEESQPASKTTVKVETKDIMKNLIDSESDEEIVTVKSEKSKENSKPKANRNKKRQRKDNKKNDPSPKRLKRVLSQDSDSDDIFGNELEEQEDVIENSDEELKIVKEIKPLAPKNKKKKLVDKTFDEDGYIITRKEWVEDSASEEEEKSETPKKEIKLETNTTYTKVKEEKVSNKSALNESNGKAAPAKTKGGKGKKVPAANQPTLMNFFKKN